MSKSKETTNLSQYELALQKKIKQMFCLFDKERNETMKPSDLGILLHSLYLCPTEQEIEEIRKMALDPDEPEILKLNQLLPSLTNVMKKNKFQPADPKTLQKAFEYLDNDKKHFLRLDELQHFFTKYGERFSKEEMTKMINFAVDTRGDRVYFTSYLPHLIITDEQYFRGMITKDDSNKSTPKEEAMETGKISQF